MGSNVISKGRRVTLGVIQRLLARKREAGSGEDIDRQGPASPVFEPGMIQAFERIGFHAFILVRSGRAGDTDTTYLSCDTQNDAPTFVAELASLPGFAESRLIRGIERALQLETYDAADLLFAWVKEGSGSLDERIFIGLPEDAPMPYYVGFPAFGIEPAGRHASDQPARLRMLQEAFDAYRTAEGNDALRFALIEAIAFALSRSLGALGRYKEASVAVHAALEHRPYSIHLKAAKHALDCKLEGTEVPGRLAKFIGEDNGYLKQFICLDPFNRFDIGPNGNVLVCCGHWLPTSIGNFVQSPVPAVLNSERAQKIRQSMTDGTYKYCNHLECGRMIQDTLPRRGEVDDPAISGAISKQDFRVERTPSLMFALDRTCNLACPSCRKERVTEKLYESDAVANAMAEKLYPLLRTVRALDINPAGELFASKPSRKILEFINDESCPDLRIDIISNATLFSEKEWSKFPGIHNKVRSIRVSTDAASQETFEKLRRPAKYDKFLENVRFLSQLRTNGTIEQLKFSFTYQRDNFREMREFVRFCQSMNADFVIFERLQNLGTFTDEEYRERAVHFPSHPYYEEFLELARDPIFQNKQVYNDFEYPGVEKLDSEEARSRRQTIAQRLVSA